MRDNKEKEIENLMNKKFLKRKQNILLFY